MFKIQVIYTRADGRTIIEVWTNGEQVKGRDQLVNPGSQGVKDTSSNRSQEDFLNSNPDGEISTTKDDLASNPIDESKLTTNGEDESAKIEDPISSAVKVPSQESEVSSSKPGETQNVFLTKLRSAIRYFHSKCHLVFKEAFNNHFI